jgi:hypothetical protein
MGHGKRPVAEQPCGCRCAAKPRRLMTNRGMAAYLTHHLGPNGWAYDPIGDVWIMPIDHDLDPGNRGIAIFERGGRCTYVNIPAWVLA